MSTQLTTTAAGSDASPESSTRSSSDSLTARIPDSDSAPVDGLALNLPNYSAEVIPEGQDEEEDESYFVEPAEEDRAAALASWATPPPSPTPSEIYTLLTETHNIKIRDFAPRPVREVADPEQRMEDLYRQYLDQSWKSTLDARSADNSQTEKSKEIGRSPSPAARLWKSLVAKVVGW
ncbi:hypothetical protein DL96DRAFT_1719073 [Flagelloscypha sp. PMI_526]|nr:hypothetical protein DL96DRAFT_1719073 [Flagelloscypha sp. PMI_526]